MKKIFGLFSIQFLGILGETLSIGNIKKKKTKMAYLGILLFFIFMSFMAFIYSYSIGYALLMFDAIEVLPSMFMALTSIIVLITTINKVKGTIFGFRDYDLLMSLPLKESKIVASRLMLLYSLNLAFTIMVMLPMMIAYGLLARPGAAFYIISIIALWFIPLVPIIIASLLGTVVAYISSKFRHSNLINVLLAFIVLILLIVVPFMFTGTEEELAQIAQGLTKQVNSTYPFAQMYSDGVINYDITALLIFIFISLAAFALFSFVVGKLFKRINTLIMTSRQDSNYELESQVQMTPLKALYRKEIKRYFSSAVYVMNTAFGVVILTVGSIALLFINLDAVIEEPGASQMLKAYVPFIISFCVFLSSTTMASISLEGKNLWIIKSLPVAIKTVFLSKIGVNLTILLPVLVDVIILAIVFDFTLMQGVIIFIMTLLSMIAVSQFGLLVNLGFPNLNWDSEVVPVKQSTASFFGVFAGMAVVLIQVGLFIYIRDFELTFLAFSLVILVANAILYAILKNYGVKKFVSLG